MTKIYLLGDIALNGLFGNQPDKNKQRFNQIENYIERNSLVFANFEIPIKAGNNINELKTVVHFAEEKSTKEILAMLNIKCVSLANNHIFDYKMDGLKKTIEVLDELEIFHTGAGWLDKHIEPVIMNSGNEKIAFLAYVDMSTNPKIEHVTELKINYFDLDKIISDVRNVRDKVDKIIFSIHWGVDYSNFFTKNQQIIARKIIDSGVDIIMGHHPHIIQPFEKYNNGLIFYSLGQLCFGDFIWNGRQQSLRKNAKLGMIAKFSKSDFSDLKLIGTHEKKFNYIFLTKINILKKNKRLSIINQLSLKFSIISYFIRIKEVFIDKIVDFIWGYYSAPLIKLTSLKKLKQISFTFKQFKQRS